jgi:hypothetical protein
MRLGQRHGALTGGGSCVTTIAVHARGHGRARDARDLS